MGRSQEAYDRRFNLCSDARQALALIKEGAVLSQDTPARRIRAWRFLLSACQLNDEPLARAFLRLGVSPNCSEALLAESNSPLSSRVHSAHLMGQREAALLMIKLGFDPNWAPPGRLAPLEAAIFNDEPEIAQALLHHGANPGAADEKGRSRLMLAASGGSEECAQITRMLLAAGADPEALDHEGLDALDYAREAEEPEEGEIIGMLRAALESKALARAFEASPLDSPSAHPARSERPRAL